MRPKLSFGRHLQASLLSLAMCFPAIGERPCLAADDETVDPNLPLVVINVASVERLINQAVVAFEAAERAELSETLGSVLDRVNDLKGFDRGQSVGVMIFLAGVGTEAVGYAPIKNLDDVLKTAEIGPITTRRTGEDRFEVVTPRQTLYGKVQEDYAFIARSTAALDRRFRDPAGLTARLSQAYDLAVTLKLKSIPPLTRDLFLTALRSKSESDLQRRDNEPEAAHKMRKAVGLRNIELIEQLVLQGEEATIGWRVSDSDRAATFEIAATAVPGSDLAATFNELRGASTRFANLLSEKAPLTALLSWRFGKSGKAMFRDIFSALESELTKVLAALDSDPQAVAADVAGPVRKWADALRSTTDSGHLDAVLQFVGQPDGRFVVVGGVKVADAADLSDPLAEILNRTKQSRAISNVGLNERVHKGVAIHSLAFAQSRRQDELRFGEPPRLFTGVGGNIVWFALGGVNAPGELERAIDAIHEPAPEGFTASPLQVVMNFGELMNYFDPENSTEGLRASARKSFARGGDALRIEALPADNGLRLRITMHEAFLRIVGQQIARRIDEATERSDETERSNE